MEVAFPVVPQHPGVVAQVGALDAAALQHRVQLAPVVARGEVDEGEHVVGQAQVLHHRVADAAHRGEGHHPFLHALGDEAQQRGVDEQVHLGRVRGLAEDVQHVAHAVPHGVDEVEAAALQVVLRVADVVQRLDHEVDRHDIQLAALELLPCPRIPATGLPHRLLIGVIPLLLA